MAFLIVGLLTKVLGGEVCCGDSGTWKYRKFDKFYGYLKLPCTVKFY